MVITLHSSSFPEVTDVLAQGLSAKIEKNNSEVVINLSATCEGSTAFVLFQKNQSLIGY